MFVSMGAQVVTTCLLGCQNTTDRQKHNTTMFSFESRSQETHTLHWWTNEWLVWNIHYPTLCICSMTAEGLKSLVITNTQVSSEMENQGIQTYAKTQHFATMLI